MEIIWTKLALVTYKEVLENLELRWSIKEIKSFVNLTNEMLTSISREDIVHRYVNQNLGIRRGIVHENVSIFYRINTIKNRVEIISFFNNRMDPKRLMMLLRK